MSPEGGKITQLRITELMPQTKSSVLSKHDSFPGFPVFMLMSKSKTWEESSILHEFFSYLNLLFVCVFVFIRTSLFIEEKNQVRIIINKSEDILRWDR